HLRMLVTEQFLAYRQALAPRGLDLHELALHGLHRGNNVERFGHLPMVVAKLTREDGHHLAIRCLCFCSLSELDEHQAEILQMIDHEGVFESGKAFRYGY